jgi:RES domain-containing protein
MTGVVDLCDTAVCAAIGINPDDLCCPWKRIAFIDKSRPPTWDIARRLFDAGVSGIRVPSVQPIGGANLVFWRWNDAPDRKVGALDPFGDLPVDQSSWRS